MKINIFEGARRLALLAAGLATVATVIYLARYEPYSSALKYRIAAPNGPLVRSVFPCPPDGASKFFYVDLKGGGHQYIDICMVPMDFPNGKKLIPYKFDMGTYWGAETFSAEVMELGRQIEANFKLPPADEEAVQAERSKVYRDAWWTGLGILAVCLAIFAGAVWAVGWIVRGFLGIPRGMDHRPESTS